MKNFLFETLLLVFLFLREELNTKTIVDHSSTIDENKNRRSYEREEDYALFRFEIDR
jgi:thioredoxin-related protein